MALAKALIEATAFIELSPDEVVDMDAGVKALESIAFTLRSASAEELAVIRRALEQLTTEELAGAARPKVLEFYTRFVDGFGLIRERPEP